MLKIRNKTLISAAAICLVLLLASLSIPALRPALFGILKQPLKLITLIRRELGGIIFYHRNFIQNERLKKEIDLLKNKLNARDEIDLENQRLENLLYFKQKSPFKLTAARVIGRSSDSWSSSIIIDKGSYNGIRSGMSAITYLGLAGRVIESQEHTSKILLISDPNLGVSAMVQRSRQEGLISGTLGSYLIMRYLPEEPDIKIGDVVITSGLNETYPKGLLIGAVVDIGKEFSGLSRYAIIKPAVELSSIEEVLVIVQ
ncbi:MAG: rod shape-determining protein MreC [Candidatus Omnitrophica bacterium]|nr:rod shape-determining protein MreC [Candidatus Omnitrophota bacterium]